MRKRQTYSTPRADTRTRNAIAKRGMAIDAQAMIRMDRMAAGTALTKAQTAAQAARDALARAQAAVAACEYQVSPAAEYKEQELFEAEQAADQAAFDEVAAARQTVVNALQVMKCRRELQQAR